MNDWKLLVVANETVASEAVREMVEEHTHGRRADVLVVAPALSSRLAFWLSDNGAARRHAAERLEGCLAPLRAAGIHAEGVVGDANPLLAIGDALALFDADEILIATHPPGESHWLEHNVIDRAQQRVSIPVHHLVVEGSRVAGVVAA
jgi:hypothetical protein